MIEIEKGQLTWIPKTVIFEEIIEIITNFKNLNITVGYM